MRRSTPDDFWAKVDKTDGCWNWTGPLTEHGYARVMYHGQYVRAHRLAFELAIGPIPVGMFICHHCDNRRCVNPTHLFVGTNQDNIRDSVSKGRWHMQQVTHCPSGHEYTAENTRLRINRSGGNSRTCRTCERNKARE